MNNFELFGHQFYSLLSVLHLKGDHTRKIIHLLAGQFVLGMGGEAGIYDLPDGWMFLQQPGYSHGIVLVDLHPHGESCHATHDEPGIKRTDSSSGFNQDFASYFLYSCFGTGYCPTDGIAVAIQKFGKRMDYIVRSPLQRTCGNGSSKGAVNG